MKPKVKYTVDDFSREAMEKDRREYERVMGRKPCLTIADLVKLADRGLDLVEF